MVATEVKECFNPSMDKDLATKLLGGSPSAAAEAIGITPQAYGQWPETLPRRLEDRVVAALARKHLPPGLLVPSESGPAETSKQAT